MKIKALTSGFGIGAVILIAAAIIALPVRTAQFFNILEGSTGFYKTTDWTVYLLYAVLAVAVIGFAALLFFMKMDYHNLKNIKLPVLKKFNIAGLLYVLGALLLVVVLFIGSDEGGTMGAKRWLCYTLS